MPAKSFTCGFRSKGIYKQPYYHKEVLQEKASKSQGHRAMATEAVHNLCIISPIHNSRHAYMYIRIVHNLLQRINPPSKYISTQKYNHPSRWQSQECQLKLCTTSRSFHQFIIEDMPINTYGTYFSTIFTYASIQTVVTNVDVLI